MPASAWPRVAFITAPTIAPAACTLPPRIFSATSGCAASASSMAARSAPSSDTTARPRAATTSSGEPSPAITPSKTWRASLSLRAPEAMSSSTRAISAGVTASDAGSTPDSLAMRVNSPAHHLRAASGATPAATEASTSSSTPALTRVAISKSPIPHACARRARCTEGCSGRVRRNSSTQSRSGAIGTRSGSGK